MNKSCNLIYIAGLILINCSNAADGYKPLPDPAYKNPPASDYNAQPLLQQAWSRQTPQTKSLRRTSPTFAPFHNWHDWKPVPHLAASFPLLVTGGLTVCPAPHGDPRLHARRPVRQMATSSSGVSTTSQLPHWLKIVEMT